MKLNKFLAVGCAAALVSMAPSSFAASSEDIDLSNPACTIALHDSTASRFVNVNYIRFIQVEKNNTEIKVSLASKYNNSSSDINLNYQSKERALQALEELRDKINDCQYDAAVRRSVKEKRNKQ